MKELLSRAEAWIEDDPDDATREELTAVLDAAVAGDADALADLEDRFRGFLEFGTAGLRGAIGAGPNRMNRAVVIRAAAGLARYLSDALAAAGVEGPARVAIGYDARHGSADFAVDTAAVMTAAGHEALLLPRTLPTPVLAFATRFLDADAGVMVTASHNPPQDNGYKVYLGGRVVTDEGRGAQIVPPYDAEIASRIAAVASVEAVPRAEKGWTVLGEGVVDEYVAQVAALGGDVTPVAERRAATRIVLTPLHGVGGETVERVLREAGFSDLHTVAEQAQPDPDFPTVAFPNPEEKGAIDLALELARSVGADVVIANDPDADRCAVATVVDGEWTMLHGDVTGSLLGERVAERRSRLRMAPGSQVLANSIVSSQQLAAIAEAHGMGHANTLTGFKWIGRTPRMVFGYEEALGYCVAPELVRDKDGVSAALLMVDFVSELKASGRTLADAIDDLARSYGVYLTSQVSARYADLAEIPATMARLMASPPATLAGSPVVATDDMSLGFRGLPGTTGLHLAAESGARVIVRPSGTEPKVKAYLEVIVPVEGDEVAGARASAVETMAQLQADVKAALGI
ncbi:phospho-sugar mutase [Demequina sp. SYSU T00039]|uniref:Phospho-sugar mutase n=1 Tax=Demequina lignilytica TaxID=3051663 RepID=A0AAW7MAG7_9MICO|nr:MULTISPECIES: phospho-sugar mutase [unclassified Demequina]MDN4478982.1 phospho-sugar mutase [Demequina sp. SYSU T00039-1]MDN4488857.1 phospho-sugar mutase [Demequina sp. SYSU T00039]MDN4491430.1 phospho-sugar mutase [Demequina sp. SYSU T00068]